MRVISTFLILIGLLVLFCLLPILRSKNQSMGLGLNSHTASGRKQIPEKNPEANEQSRK